MSAPSYPDWACRGCGFSRRHCTCPDPATPADKIRSLLLVVIALGAVLILLVSFCLSVHGSGMH